MAEVKKQKLLTIKQKYKGTLDVWTTGDDDLFHIHTTVCPRCGKNKRYFNIKTVRWVDKASWWERSTGMWQELEEH